MKYKSRQRAQCARPVSLIVVGTLLIIILLYAYTAVLILLNTKEYMVLNNTEKKLMQPKQEKKLGESLTIPNIDMKAIAQIESSGGKHTKSKISGDSVGTFQVRPIVARDYEIEHKLPKGSVDLKDAAKNQEIATWYFTKRIPQLLKRGGVPVTVEHLIAGYNMGPDQTVKWYKSSGGDIKSLPSITYKYIDKYKTFVDGMTKKLEEGNKKAIAKESDAPMEVQGDGIGQSTEELKGV